MCQKRAVLRARLLDLENRSYRSKVCTILVFRASRNEITLRLCSKYFPVPFRSLQPRSRVEGCIISRAKSQASLHATIGRVTTFIPPGSQIYYSSPLVLRSGVASRSSTTPPPPPPPLSPLCPPSCDGLRGLPSAGLLQQLLRVSELPLSCVSQFSSWSIFSWGTGRF